MNWTTIIIALFALSACNPQTDKTAVGEKPPTLPLDTFYIDSNEIGEPNREYHDCNFVQYIEDRKTPELAKDIYLGKEWNLSHENELLALLDSLVAKNKASRPFYFKVVTLSHKKSDGYFSEGLGHAGQAYVENNTQEFISHFDHANCFTENDLATWADIVLLEFSQGGEKAHEKPILKDYIRKLKANCKDCSSTQKANLHTFGSMLENKWNRLLENMGS